MSARSGPVRAAWPRLLAAWLIVLTVGAPALAQATAPATRADVTRFLQLTGIDTALDAIPLNARAWADALAARQALDPAQATELQAYAAGDPVATPLQEALIERLVVVLDATTLARAVQALELAAVADFRAGIALPVDAAGNASFAAYRARLREQPPFPERLAMVRRLLATGRTPELLLLVNTANEHRLRDYLQRAWQRGEPETTAPAAILRARSEAAQREALRGLCEEMYLFGLRYADPERLAAVSATLADARIQHLLDLTLAALRAELAAR